jgi:hypothetical protein
MKTNIREIIRIKIGIEEPLSKKNKNKTMWGKRERRNNKTKKRKGGRI